MKALWFGTYDRAHPRNRQAISCLRSAGVAVVERHRDVWGRHNWSAGPSRLARLARAELALARRVEESADVVVVGYPGQLDVAAARRAAEGRPVVFDPLVSLHDTLVGDRARFAPRSVAARALLRVDRAAFGVVDVLVADTAAQARFYVDRFGVPPERVEVAFVGAEDALFAPGPSGASRPPFRALFVGKLTPLHGVDVILEAARLAPEISFRVVGEGQLAALLRSAPPNVTCVPWVRYVHLPDEYRRAGCALGIFGAGPKAARVIPTKVFQALACACPVVTADTPAARELLASGRDALLVPAGDARALAAAVRALAGDAARAEQLAASGRRVYEAHASEQVLGRRWRQLLERALAG